jgi:hypothetical protein
MVALDQLGLFGDRHSNVGLYPKLQEYFRTTCPPLHAPWGKNDPLFLPVGAVSFTTEVHPPEVGQIALKNE